MTTSDPCHNYQMGCQHPAGGWGGGESSSYRLLQPRALAHDVENPHRRWSEKISCRWTRVLLHREREEREVVLGGGGGGPQISS